MKKTTPQQCEIYWANLNPTKGSEQFGKRPVVVVSGNTMNEHLPVCIVCPISTKIKKYHTCTVIKKNRINKLKEDSEIITFQVRTVSTARLEEKIGAITPTELQDVINKIGHLLQY
jgi:mRNA interferase MazF